jgi:hypothetical protein
VKLIIAAVAIFVTSSCTPQPTPAASRSPAPTTDAPEAVVVEPPAEPAPAVGPEPVATTAAQPSADGSSGHSCLMRRVCGCSLGCATIGVAPNDLRVGLRSVITWGAGMGETGVVVKVVASDSSDVFALSNVGPDEPSMCSTSARTGSLLGFACDKNHMGPVHPDACENACRD